MTPDPSDVIDLTLSSPPARCSGSTATAASTSTAVKKEIKSEVIDLCISPPLNNNKISPLKTESGNSTSGPHRRTLVAVKQEVKSEVIDLRSSPTSNPTPPKMKFEEDQDLEYIGRWNSRQKRHSHSPSSAPHPASPGLTRPKVTVIHDIQAGSFYPSFAKAQEAVYNREHRLGHIWHVSQSKTLSSGVLKKVILRCNHYRNPTPTHSSTIDPSDHREGKSVKTNCMAHVNLNRQADGLWRVTLVDWHHNHPSQVPAGGRIARPPTQAQRDVVRQFAAAGSFSRDHLRRILDTQFPDHPLEPRQISNLINEARTSARQEVDALGGDIATILESLRVKAEQEHGWKYVIRLDESQTVIGLWWQSPVQSELTRRYADILINDNTYNRNQYGYPLNIGIIIDNFGRSRNAWYAFHRSEDTPTHNWVFQQHLESAGVPPEVVASDRHPSLIASVERTMPLTQHIYCLHHLNGNMTQHLQMALGRDWDNFKRDFWATFRAISPEEFEKLWGHLLVRYPSAHRYLTEELYPCRERWAHPWVSKIFTAGVRTNGRVEGENRINKLIGGPKKTFLQLFDGLNERSEDQTTRDLIQVRQVSMDVIVDR